MTELHNIELSLLDDAPRNANAMDPFLSNQLTENLTAARKRGEVRREEIRLKATPLAPRRPTWLRLSVRSFPSPERDAIDGSKRGALVLWQVADITDERTRESQKIGALEAALG